MLRIFLLSVICFASLSVFAQKEIVFEDVNSSNIKVKSTQGIDVNFILNLSNGSYLNSSKAPLYIGYFHENSTSPNWTFITTTGLYAEFGTRPVNKLNDSTNLIYFDNIFRNTQSLSLGVGLESRWYLNKNEGYKTGKAKLNSGLFLSFPVNLKTTLLQTPEPLYYQKLFPSHFNVNVYFMPTVGYRKTLSDRLFLEGCFGFGAYVGIGSGKNFYNYPVSIISTPVFNGQFKIKAAYSF